MTFDTNGYPTEETLEEIKNISPINKKSIWKLLDIVETHWHWNNMFILDKEKGCLELHTGGWSGNEDIIYALKENYVFWGLCWYKSMCGGHYWFDLRRWLKNDT